jgi:hypothetical protein
MKEGVMKGLSVLMAIVVAGLVIGCTDQNSIVNPATPLEMANSPAPPPLGQGVWNIDKLVYATSNGATYHIYGEIFWTLSENAGEYSFTTDVKTEVSLVAVDARAVTVAGQMVSKGSVSKSGNLTVTNEFATDGLAPSSALHLEYTIGERVRLSDVSITFRPWDSRQAQLTK